MVCFSRRTACRFERAEQLKCRLDAIRFVLGVPFVRYISRAAQCRRGIMHRSRCCRSSGLFGTDLHRPCARQRCRWRDRTADAGLCRLSRRPLILLGRSTNAWRTGGYRGPSSRPLSNELFRCPVFRVHEYDVLGIAPRRVDREKHDGPLEDVGQGVNSPRLKNSKFPGENSPGFSGLPIQKVPRPDST